MTQIKELKERNSGVTMFRCIGAMALLAIALSAATLQAAPAPQPQPDPLLHKPAPSFVRTGLNHQRVDLAAYRIIQESLTNAIRHAGPATAMVSLAWGEDRLGLEVRDTGRGASANEGPPDGAVSGAGHGLVGMRERALAAGGTFEAGSSPGGGFAVHAELPLDGTA